MRKILLASTAVVGAAVFAPTVAEAQQAPTVRIGGYFRAYYGYTQQTGMAPTNVLMAQNAGPGETGQTVSGTNVGVAPASARLGHNDFSTDTEVHVIVSGKAANGLTYGARIEIEFDTSEGTTRSDARRAFTRRTGAAIDEMYAFLAMPGLGQVRFGDEDGPFGGLMNVGWVSNFGTGGAFGEFESFVVRPGRTGTTPGGVGDNSKIIYLSPQFFGFDFGFSYAPNEGEGEDTGCLNSFASINCDRVYAATGAGIGRSHEGPGRTDEVQASIRWRGNIGGVGLAAGFSTMQAAAVRNISTTGNITRTNKNIEVYQAGLQASAFGFTIGGGYMWGTPNFFYIPAPRGSQDMEQWFGGASYTIGAFSLGANFYTGTYAGNGGNPRAQRRWAYGIGANYRLAPGLDLIAEFVRQEFNEPGTSQNIPTSNIVSGPGAPASAGGVGGNDVRDRVTSSVFLTGIRLAF